MNEQELKGLYCGVFKQYSPDWWDKQTLYQKADVRKLYTAIKKSLAVILTDHQGDFNSKLADEIAQFQVDSYLIRKARGERVSAPEVYGVVKKEKAKKAEMTLFDISDFSEDAKNAVSDPVAEITWIFGNLAIRGIEPKDAPSVGAYMYLMWAQEGPANKADFLKTTYSKIVPSKSQIDKGGGNNDDGRETTKLIERLLGEIARDKKAIPVL